MNKVTLFYILLILSIGTDPTFAQDSSKPAEKDENQFSFGNISPVILSKDGIEASTTHSLTSYWVTSKFGTRILDRYRISRLESNINLQYGFSNSKRWDLGAQVRYGRIRIDENARNSPFKVFSPADATSTAYQGISYVGLRLRTAPIKNSQAFTLQGSVFFPTIKDKTARSSLGADRIQTDLTGTYFKSINKNNDAYVYVQGRYLAQLANEENNKTTHYPGLSILLVKSILNQTAFLFPGLSYTGAYQQNYSGGRLTKQASFLMASLGIQVQPIEAFSLFINAQRPLIYTSSVSFYSDLIKNSYSDWALGLRFVL